VVYLPLINSKYIRPVIKEARDQSTLTVADQVGGFTDKAGGVVAFVRKRDGRLALKINERNADLAKLTLSKDWLNQLTQSGYIDK
jgi:hypothetical protein